MPFQPIRTALALAVLATVAAGCGGSKAPGGHTPPARPTILAAAVQPTTFAQVRRAVLAVYDRHPGIAAFRVQDVEYTAKTRDKVLSVCHDGGSEKSARALESSRVLACAPLIFFLYSYGRESADGDAVAAAQALYWFAVSSNRRPYDAQPGLVTLLRQWGIR